MVRPLRNWISQLLVVPLAFFLFSKWLLKFPFSKAFLSGAFIFNYWIVFIHWALLPESFRCQTKLARERLGENYVPERLQAILWHTGQKIPVIWWFQYWNIYLASCPASPIKWFITVHFLFLLNVPIGYCLVFQVAVCLAVFNFSNVKWTVKK